MNTWLHYHHPRQAVSVPKKREALRFAVRSVPSALVIPALESADITFHSAIRSDNDVGSSREEHHVVNLQESTSGTTKSLSQNCPPVGRQAVGQLDQSEVVLSLLLPSYQEPPELVEPGRTPLHDPPLRLVAPHGVLHLSPVAHVRYVLPLDHPSLYLRVVLPLVQAEVLRMVAAWGRPRDDDAVQGLERRLHVVRVGPSDHSGEGRPPLVGQDVPLRTELAPISGVGTCTFPPEGSFDRAGVERLPLQLDVPQPVVPPEELDPELLEDALSHPLLEPHVGS